MSRPPAEQDTQLPDPNQSPPATDDDQPSSPPPPPPQEKNAPPTAAATDAPPPTDSSIRRPFVEPSSMERVEKGRFIMTTDNVQRKPSSSEPPSQGSVQPERTPKEHVERKPITLRDPVRAREWVRRLKALREGDDESGVSDSFLTDPPGRSDEVAVDDTLIAERLARLHVLAGDEAPKAKLLSGISESAVSEAPKAVKVEETHQEIESKKRRCDVLVESGVRDLNLRPGIGDCSRTSVTHALHQPSVSSGAYSGSPSSTFGAMDCFPSKRAKLSTSRPLSTTAPSATMSIAGGLSGSSQQQAVHGDPAGSKSTSSSSTSPSLSTSKTMDWSSSQ